MAAIRAAERGAHAEAALSEVQAVAGGAAYAVVLHPLHVRLIDAALQHQVFEQAAYGIVGERGDDGRLQSEAAPQPARDVVFAAALPHAELPRRRDADIAGIEPQHHFAERDQVPLAGFLRAQREAVLIVRCRHLAPYFKILNRDRVHVCVVLIFSAHAPAEAVVLRAHTGVDRPARRDDDLLIGDDEVAGGVGRTHQVHDALIGLNIEVEINFTTGACACARAWCSSCCPVRAA